MNCHSDSFTTTPQQDRILKYIIKFGSITPLDAFRDLGVTKLATRISELRRKGFLFTQRLEESVNRYGETVHYMRYSFPLMEVREDD